MGNREQWIDVMIGAITGLILTAVLFLFLFRNVKGYGLVEAYLFGAGGVICGTIFGGVLGGLLSPSCSTRPRPVSREKRDTPEADR